jgi:hypothetical protein
MKLLKLRCKNKMSADHYLGFQVPMNGYGCFVLDSEETQRFRGTCRLYLQGRTLR